MERLSRREALRILELGPSADVGEVKRAYRRLARERHPDVGGDPDDFHRLRHAYERLLHERGNRRQSSRSSRPRGASWAESPIRSHSDELVDLEGVQWDRPRPAGTVARADTELVAVLLTSPRAAGPVHPVAGRSRGPRSPLNRFIRYLDPDLTATWRVEPARSRGRLDHDVELLLRVWSRGARRRVDAVTLPPGWTASRGSSSTTVVRTLHPSRDERATAIRATRSLEELLDALEWPLDAWYVDLAPFDDTSR